MSKNIQLEELQAIEQTASALRKFIFLYEKDSSIDPVCMTIEELFRRILSDPTTQDGTQNQEFLGLASIKNTVNGIQNRLNDYKTEILQQLGGANKLNEIGQSIASIQRIINGESGSGNGGIVKKLQELEKNLQQLSSSLNAITQSNSSLTGSISAISSVANGAKSKSEENERRLNEIVGASGLQLLGWRII